ncbi:MAG TPA: protein-L-isoaspartate(D-aspartate) O-methyltransferase [Holophagaceae bacterium]
MRRYLGAALALVLGACEPERAQPPAPPTEAALAAARTNMVRDQLAARGIRDARILGAMGRTPRHAFVSPEQASLAYEDTPLPIGYGQTISQPFIVALMTLAVDPRPGDRVLEVGTGSGYQAAVLSGLVAEVYSVEIVAPLARRAEAALRRQGCANVHVRAGDGYGGWPEAAPFDAILVTCAPDHVPQPLVDQLKVGGRMVIPVGPAGGAQELILLRKSARGLERVEVLPVRFVPLVRGNS